MNNSGITDKINQIGWHIRARERFQRDPHRKNLFFGDDCGLEILDLEVVTDAKSWKCTNWEG